MGEWDASSTSESYAHQDYSVTTVLIHPDFYPPGVFYDLALLALNVDADTTKPNIGVACLPSLGTASQSGKKKVPAEKKSKLSGSTENKITYSKTAIDG